MHFATKLIYIISFFIFTNLSGSVAQNYVGVLGGINKEKFIDFSKDEYYHTKYNLKNGTSLSTFYETNNDSSSNIRVEFQYKYQNADIEIENNEGHASFYKKLDFSFQQLNINFDFLFLIHDFNSMKISFLTGPSLSYTFQSNSAGNGWEYVSKTFIDSNNVSFQGIGVNYWEKNEKNSKDLSIYNFAFEFGLELQIPLKRNLKLILQNKYYLSLTNSLNINNLKHTSLLSGHLNFGLIYNLY